jgi:hypothetical protein
MDGVFMYRYAVDENGNLISKLDEGQDYGYNIFESETDLGNGEIIGKGRFRCYRYMIVNDQPIEQQIKRYGIKDENNDIIIDMHYNSVPDTGIEIQEDIIVLDEKYDVPNYYVDGSIVKVKPNKGDRPELQAKIDKIDDAETEDKIKEKYSVGKELKLMKLYMDWIKEGMPGDDPRQADYENMQAEIAIIKGS